MEKPQLWVRVIYLFKYNTQRILLFVCAEKLLIFYVNTTTRLGICIWDIVLRLELFISRHVCVLYYDPFYNKNKILFYPHLIAGGYSIYLISHFNSTKSRKIFCFVLISGHAYIPFTPNPNIKCMYILFHIRYYCFFFGNIYSLFHIKLMCLYWLAGGVFKVV